MSFFDEDDEPTARRSPRPRRPRPAAAGATGGDQSILVRRAVALGVGLLILVLLVVAVNSCRTSAKKNALKDYNRSVAALVQESDGQIRDQFFALFDSGSKESGADLAGQVAGYREEAEIRLDQAEKLDVPGEMVTAQRSLLIALELRRDALDYIAGRIRTAQGAEGDAADEAVTQIAGQMQSFVASDVLIAARVTPTIKKALDDAEIGGQRVAGHDDKGGSLPALSWLSPSFVADQLGQKLSGGSTSGGAKGDPAPGTHGTGLTSVSSGDITLQPEGSDQPNRIAVGSNLTFTVKFQNQGENDETDVKVVLRISGSGKPIRVEKTVDFVAKGTPATANLQLTSTPPIGEPLTLEVEVRAVPGEKLTDNNKQSYPVFFTR